MENLVKFNEIEAMLPLYVKDKGNCTELITLASSCIRNATVETCIRNLADYYNLSLYHNRINYGAELGITNKVPIVINDNLVFIYINVREPLFKHDAAYGFIDIKAIDNIFLNEGKAAIQMKSGRIIQTRESVKSLRKNMFNGRIAKDIYKEKHKKQ
ncbi:MAG: hypothetical protein ACERLG_06305 [Sedimentibacter sp.]